MTDWNVGQGIYADNTSCARVICSRSTDATLACGASFSLREHGGEFRAEPAKPDAGNWPYRVGAAISVYDCRAPELSR